MNPFDQMREQISAFPFTKLADAQRTVAQAMATLPRRVGELGRNLEIAEAKAAQRERVLMMEHGSNIPTDDEELALLRADVAKAKEQLREINVNQTKLRDLFKCLREELGQRAMELDSQVRRQCEATWKGLKEEMCADAVESLAIAILSTAHTSGLNPEQVDLSMFVNNILGDALRARIKLEADKLKQKIREEIVKNNDKLG